MRTSICVAAFSTQALCSAVGLSLLKTVPHDVVGPQGINFDGAIIAQGDTGVSVLWFNKTASQIELYCAEPLQTSASARKVVEKYLQ